MSGEYPLQSAFPLTVSRKLYNLAVKEGVDPALLEIARSPVKLVPPPGPVWCPGRETRQVHGQTSYYRDGELIERNHEHACVECGKRVPCLGTKEPPTMGRHKTTDEAIRRRVIPLDRWVPEPPKLCERKGCTNEVPYEGRRICDACRALNGRPPCMEPGCEAPRAPYKRRCDEHAEEARRREYGET